MAAEMKNCIYVYVWIALRVSAGCE